MCIFFFSWDCGVFTCMAAYFLSDEQELTYNQNHMEDIRLRMVHQIKNKDADYHVRDYLR